MKGMVLAAGLGTRMGPISRYLAKPAVPFLGVPMIEYSVGVLHSGGIRDIVVNLHHLPETVKRVLGDGKRLGVNIEYSFENPVLGTGGGIGRVRDFFGEDTFVVINADVVMDVDLSDVIAAHRSAEPSATLVLRPDRDSRYGKVYFESDNRIRQIEQFPEGADTRGCEILMFAGLHVIEPVWFDFAPSQPVYDSIRDVYSPMLAAGERIHAYRYDGRWVDLGSARRLLAASIVDLDESVIPRSAVVGSGTDLHRTALYAGVDIGNDCRIEDSIFLGSASVGDRCLLRHCIVCPHSIVPSDSFFEGAVITEDGIQRLDEFPF